MNFYNMQGSLKKGLLLLAVTHFVGVVSESFDVFDANARLLYSKSQMQKEVRNAENKLRNQLNTQFNKEKQDLQKTISDNQNQIKTLKSNLNTANNNYKKLSNDKANYEKKAKADLAKLTSEKTKTTNELNQAKKNFDTTKKNLENSINNLKKEVQKKESEKTALSKKVATIEKARKDADAKAKQNQTTQKKQYDAKINTLNKQIKTKTNQLNRKTKQLKALTNEYNSFKTSASKSESDNFVEIEILRGEVRNLKTELKILVAKAKEIDEEKERFIQDMQKEFEAKRQNFLDQIKANQELELQNLQKIEELNALSYKLAKKNHELEEAGRVMESKYIAKIATIQKQYDEQNKKYNEVIKAYAEAESQNLLMIDSLKSQLNEAKKKNEALIQLADKMHKDKVAEDIADAELETRALMKIEELNNKLAKAKKKNDLLIASMAKMKNHVEDLKKGVDESGWRKDSIFSTSEKNPAGMTSNQSRSSQTLVPNNSNQNNGSVSITDRNTAEIVNRLKRSSFSNAPKAKEDELVDFAIDATLKALQKILNNDADKVNASMNLIGSGQELPKKLNAIIDTIKKRFNPEVFDKAIKEIGRRYNSRKNFINESMKHLYGEQGDELVDWSL